MIKLIKSLIPERCALCGEPVEYGRNSPFCRICHVKWEFEKQSHRHEAYGQPIAEYPHRPDETERYGLVPHLTAYKPDNRDSASTALIFKLKHRATPRLIGLVADEFANMITDSTGVLFCNDRKTDNTAVTFVPRSRGAVKRDGYDHMELCARATAEKLGIRFMKPLVRSSGALEQKKLDAEGRIENARKTICIKPSFIKPSFIKPGCSVCGITFILLDDIMTTGASLNISAELLLAAGAKSVVAAVIASTVAR